MTPELLETIMDAARSDVMQRQSLIRSIAVRRGLDRARARGVVIGRPKPHRLHQAAAISGGLLRALANGEVTIRGLATYWRVSKSHAHRRVARLVTDVLSRKELQ